MIGDVDPEDAYDADDRPRDRLKVLEAIVAELYASDPSDPRRETRRVDALRVVTAFEDDLAQWRSRLEAVRTALEDL